MVSNTFVFFFETYTQVRTSAHIFNHDVDDDDDNCVFACDLHLVFSFQTLTYDIYIHDTNVTSSHNIVVNN